MGLQALGIQSWPALLLKSKFKLEKYLGLSVLRYNNFSMEGTVGGFSVGFNSG